MWCCGGVAGCVFGQSFPLWTNPTAMEPRLTLKRPREEEDKPLSDTRNGRRRAAPLRVSFKHRGRSTSTDAVVKFTNCRILRNGRLVWEDLWVRCVDENAQWTLGSRG